jgi:gliding motility-associated-like protein
MNNFYPKRAVLLFFIFCLATVAVAQPGCPNINAGSDVALPCGTNCANLNATFFQTGSTTSYGVSSIPYSPPFPFTGGTQLFINADDRFSDSITLPFSFCFYGNQYRKAVIGANGLISFDLTNALQRCEFAFNASIPTPGPPSAGIYNNSINGAFHDIDPSVGDFTFLPPFIVYPANINYAVLGSAPCRTFVVNFSTVPHYSCNSLRTTQQIVLYETTNVIEVYIKDKPTCNSWNNGNAAIGIQNIDGSQGLAPPGRNTGPWSATNEAWRFTPNGPSIVTVEWLQGGSVIGTGASLSVCPGGTTTYTARATYLPCNGGVPVVVNDNVNVSLAGALQAGIDSSRNVTCFGANNGVAYAHATTSNAGLSYGWANGGPNTLSYSNLAPGTYIFTATDASACVRSDTVIITGPALLTANVPNVSQTNCSGTGIGTLLAGYTGGTGPFSFVWNSVPVQNDSVLNGVSAGTYSVTVTDSKACTATASGTLTITAGGNTVALGAPTITSPSCFGGADGSITANPSGGTGIYNYVWSNGPTTATDPNLTAGPYTVTVDDGAGCTATGTYTVSQPALLALNAPTITNIGCTALTGTIVANPTGGTPAYNYSWSRPSDGQTYAGQTIGNLSADNYNVTVTDTKACSVTASYTITSVPTITFTQSQVDVLCFGGNNGSATITVNTGTGPYNYNWNGNGPTTNATLSNLSAGVVDVTVTDANLCAASATFTITEPTAVVLGAPVITNVTCTSSGSITAAASGGTGTIGFVWSDAQTGATATNLSPGNYSVTATDQNGCTASAAYTVGTTGNVVTINAPTITNVSCAGGNNGSITANPTGGNGVYSYAWSNSQVGATASLLVANQYRVTITDGTGCSASAIYTVTEPAALVLDSVAVINLTCTGGLGSLTAYVSGGTPAYSYSWAAQNSGQTYTGSAISSLQADIYSLTITDNSACSITASNSVTQPVSIIFTQSQTNVSCNSGNNGSATITVTSGTPPYQYNWNGTATGNATINGLAAGPVDVTITDANCSVTANFIITEPTPVQLAVVNQTDVSCFGGANGSVEVLATGGTGAFTYAWNSNPLQTGPVAANLPAGIVTVTATDVNLCTITQTFTLTQPDTLTLALSHLNATCYQAPNGSISSVVAGGTPPYTYLWSDNQTTASAFGLLKGTYLVTVTDGKGCTVQGFDTIGEPDDIVIDLSVTAVKCVGDKNGTITVVATGGTSPYNYSATQDGSNFINTTDGLILGLAIGTYTVIISDNNGCTQTRFATIPNASIDNFITSTDSTSCYGTDYNDGGAHIEALSIQNGPYLYAVDGGGTQYSGDFSFLSAGYHTITAISNFGCISEVPVLVLQPLPIVVDVVPDTVYLPLGQSQQVAVTYLNAPGQVSYSWTPELGLSCTDCPNPVVSPFTEQDYVITLSMVNGTATCYGSATLHASLTEALPLFIPSAFTPNGDGNNDLFQVYGQGIKKVDMKIFNRWGELVYQSNNQFSGWDGTYKGQVQQPQVLTYTVSVVFLDDTKAEKNGTITLVR